MNTLVEYLYRDAGNYKSRGKFVFRGQPTASELLRLRAALIDGEWILPQKVGLPPVAPWIRGEAPYLTDLDHEYHELVWPPTSTSLPPDRPHTHFREFLDRMETANRI